MSCRLTILGSGSGGNCAYLESDTTRLLIDAGLSGRQIEERLASIGKSMTQVNAVLLTHEHSDHIQGLKVLGARYRIPIYSNRMTREAVMENLNNKGTRMVPLDWKSFESGQAFAAGDFDVEPFTIPHDAADPVGFLIHHQKETICFLTDLGHVNRMILDKARRATALLLETNYDVRLLQGDPHRPWSLKQRISGRHGHLSNEAAGSALPDIVTDRLKHVFLCHLSQDCNRPELAEKAVQGRLDVLGASHIRLTVTSQNHPCDTENFEWNTSPVQDSLLSSPRPSGELLL